MKNKMKKMIKKNREMMKKEKEKEKEKEKDLLLKLQLLKLQLMDDEDKESGPSTLYKRKATTVDSDPASKLVDGEDCRLSNILRERARLEEQHTSSGDFNLDHTAAADKPQSSSSSQEQEYKAPIMSAAGATDKPKSPSSQVDSGPIMSAAVADAAKPKSSSPSQEQEDKAPIMSGNKSQPSKEEKEKRAELKARRKRDAALELENRLRYMDRIREQYRKEADDIATAAGLVDDDPDLEFNMYRRGWNTRYLPEYVSFEDTTVVPAMRYSCPPVPEEADCNCGLQIYSIKIVELSEDEGLHWPLHVYGLVATRDTVDPRRNLLFNRTRDDCQILTQEDPFLMLTGPSRAIVAFNPVWFEFQLKAKGKTESEDKVLYRTVFSSGYGTKTSVCFFHNQSSFEVEFEVLPDSVEATIDAQLLEGSWPDNCRARIVSRTNCGEDNEIVLLDSRDGLHLGDFDMIELSRCVVSVELTGELMVDVVASIVDDSKNDKVIAKAQAILTPLIAMSSESECDLGFCKLNITAFWSLLSPPNS